MKTYEQNGKLQNGKLFDLPTNICGFGKKNPNEIGLLSNTQFNLCSIIKKTS
jgi:hypothetical protein